MSSPTRSTSTPAQQTEDNGPGRLARGTNWLLKQQSTLLSYGLKSLIDLVAVPAAIIDDQGRKFESKLATNRWVPKRNPFSLRRYGNTLLSPTVESELDVLSMVLALVFCFELFAWSAMWALTGVGVLWTIALSLIFTSVVVIMDRAILIMDDKGGRSRWAVLAGRLALLLGIALVNSVPVELKIFAPEINQVIERDEKVKVDKIRAQARALEIAKIGERTATTNDNVDSQADDVTARRTTERAAIADGHRVNRADIVRRLEAKSQELADEIGEGLRTGKPGDGPAARSLRAQEAQLQAELQAFDEQSRQQLVDFDDRTEGMRSGTAKIGLDEQARREAELDAKLAAIETMPADQLARNYGGTYKEPDGFMARYRVLELLTAAMPTDGRWFSAEQKVALGAWLIMTFLSLSILLLKYVMMSAETRTYFSEDCQALGGNVHAIEAARVRARNGDRQAVAILLRLEDMDHKTHNLLRRLGHNPNHQSLGWSDDVRSMHIEFDQAQAEFQAAWEGFEAFFRELCRETVTTAGIQSNLDRSQLRQRSEAEWDMSVRPALHRYGRAESVMSAHGVDVPRWTHDPRYSHEHGRLWQLGDEMLRVNYGWVNPRPQLSQPVASA